MLKDKMTRNLILIFVFSNVVSLIIMYFKVIPEQRWSTQFFLFSFLYSFFVLTFILMGMGCIAVVWTSVSKK